MADFGWDGTPDLVRLVVKRLGRIYSHLDWFFVSVCKSQAQAIAFDFASAHSSAVKAV
jgi:uncharacterized protein YejL (UPF0352 family)